MRLIVILFMGLFVSALASAISDAKHATCVKVEGATEIAQGAGKSVVREPNKGGQRQLVCENK